MSAQTSPSAHAARRLARVEAAVEWLATESRELWLPARLPRLDGPPAPLAFLRERVLMSAPCVIAGAMDGPEWAAARERWSIEFLSAAMGSMPVTINVTPDGRGDAVIGGNRRDGLVVGGRFVKPEEREMTFTAFAAALRAGASSGVHYLSIQDDNLRTQHAPLAADVPTSVAWFEEALGCGPDAVNLWIGDRSAVSSVHADHYENLYCVVRGEKIFTLLPPADAISRDLTGRRPARYVQRRKESDDCAEVGSWALVDDAAPDGGAEASVEWIGLDPADAAQLPKQSACITVRVRSGEMLYLPANWFHRVTQSEETIAVNYWHDPIRESVPPAHVLAQFARKVQRALYGEADDDGVSGEKVPEGGNGLKPVSTSR